MGIGKVSALQESKHSRHTYYFQEHTVHPTPWGWFQKKPNFILPTPNRHPPKKEYQPQSFRKSMLMDKRNKGKYECERKGMKREAEPPSYALYVNGRRQKTPCIDRWYVQAGSPTEAMCANNVIEKI